jgi:uncharacterized protein with PIN domain
VKTWGWLCYTTSDVTEDTARIADKAPKFAADRMLVRLARWLRLMGADVLHDPTISGAEMLRLAREEGRPLLTRDKRLRTAPDVLYIENHLFRDQLHEVMERYPFDPRRFAYCVGVGVLASGAFSHCHRRE